MRKVLSVPAGKTHDWILQHKVYSCPEEYCYPEAKHFAPRDAKGDIHVVFKIDSVHSANPFDIDAENLPEHARRRISGYISAVQHKKGILDNGGSYRFYLLSECEEGHLNPPAKTRTRLTNACCFDFEELVSKKPFVEPL